MEMNFPYCLKYPYHPTFYKDGKNETKDTSPLYRVQNHSML